MSKAKLWKIFSEYIRLRDSDNRGYCRCIYCDRVHNYKDIHAGHFIPKNKGWSIYFDEQNVNSQCAYCNLMLHGNQYAYGKAINDKYGKSVADKLI
ncbi:MAG: recombinase [Candidatus Methanofastidiosa archaeon]|nr:recombinase [Candidatus Methanofastidiosa archaeon]